MARAKQRPTTDFGGKFTIHKKDGNAYFNPVVLAGDDWQQVRQELIKNYGNGIYEVEYLNRKTGKLENDTLEVTNHDVFKHVRQEMPEKPTRKRNPNDMNNNNQPLIVQQDNTALLAYLTKQGEMQQELINKLLLAQIDKKPISQDDVFEQARKLNELNDKAVEKAKQDLERYYDNVNVEENPVNFQSIGSLISAMGMLGNNNGGENLNGYDNPRLKALEERVDQVVENLNLLVNKLSGKNEQTEQNV